MSFGTAETQGQTRGRLRDYIKPYLICSAVVFGAAMLLGTMNLFLHPEVGQRWLTRRIFDNETLKLNQIIERKEASIVRTCDMLAKRSAKNPSSFSTAWDKRVYSRGITIYRKFIAMNAFGVNVDHFYVCGYDGTSQKFDLHINEGSY